MIVVISKVFIFKRAIVHFVMGESGISKPMLLHHPDVVLLDGLTGWSSNKETEKGSGLTYLFRFDGVKSHEDLFCKLRKQYRKEIRHCSARAKIDFFTSDQITTGLLREFAKVANEMYSSIGLKTRVKIRLFRAHANAGALMISRSSSDGVAYTYHAYVVDGKHATSWMAGDVFRKKGIDRKLAGQIHKYHKYMDLCWFFDRGYEDYDWGGISSFEHPNGIDEFKMGFPGEKHVTYEERFPITKKGYLYFWFKKVLHK